MVENGADRAGAPMLGRGRDAGDADRADRRPVMEGNVVDGDDLRDQRLVVVQKRAEGVFLKRLLLFFFDVYGVGKGQRGQLGALVKLVVSQFPNQHSCKSPSVSVLRAGRCAFIEIIPAFPPAVNTILLQKSFL